MATKSKNIKVIVRCNRYQTKALQERVRTAQFKKYDSLEYSPKPKEIRAMERAVAAWYRVENTKIRKVREAVAREKKKLDDFILFAAVDEALAAVDAFERKWSVQRAR